MKSGNNFYCGELQNFELVDSNLTITILLDEYVFDLSSEPKLQIKLYNTKNFKIKQLADYNNKFETEFTLNQQSLVISHYNVGEIEIAFSKVETAILPYEIEDLKKKILFSKECYDNECETNAKLDSKVKNIESLVGKELISIEEKLEFFANDEAKKEALKKQQLLLNKIKNLIEQK